MAETRETERKAEKYDLLIEKLEKIKDYMLEDQYVGRYYIEDIDEILSFVKGEKR